MASFQAKMGSKRPRNKESNNYRSVPFLHDAKQKIPKKQKKIRKVKKYHYGLISSQNRLEKDEKERKQKLLLCFVPTRREIENSKKIAKKFKILKNTIMAPLQAKICWKTQRNREN